MKAITQFSNEFLKISINLFMKSVSYIVLN